LRFALETKLIVHLNINREEGSFIATRTASALRRIAATCFSGVEWLIPGGEKCDVNAIAVI
jgi:hypothetical protein